MTPQEINVACAELSGWSAIEDFSGPLMMAPGTFMRGYPPKDALVGKKQDIPNYHGDANAALGLCELMAKNGLITQCSNAQMDIWTVTVKMPQRDIHSFNQSLSAAICECFLRVKGKWRE